MKAMNRVPGVGSSTEYGFRRIMAGGQPQYLPGGIVIDGTYARDPSNASYVDRLQCGLMMGRITASKLWAPSVIGTLGTTIAGTATTLAFLHTEEATELVRRVGTTGTFKITGPHVSGGRVKTRTLTYSAVGAGSGANEVQTFTPDAAASAGTYRIKLQKPDGTSVWTAAIAYGATLAACQAAITLALGAVAGWVASSAGSAAPWSAGPIALVLTASGTGYTAHDYPMCEIDITSMTGPTAITGVQTTRGFPVAATVTITAPGLAAANCVQTWTPNAAWTAGTMSFGFTHPTTGAIHWLTFTYTTDLATTLAAINVILDAEFGTSMIVATGGGNITSLIFTYSGGVFAGREHALPLVSYSGATGAASTTTFTNVAGYSEAFYAGSLIQPTDGSETPLGLLGVDSGLKVTDDDGSTNLDVECSRLIIGSGNGVVDAGQIINYPSDTSLRAWIKEKLRAAGSGYVFDDDHVG
ncbi:MAG TPA: hypothetical protein VMY42_20950 [Thermoguttaceae bacterium]|nr:hypothetical protein [Thermoguttaceae bacterium]